MKKKKIIVLEFIKLISYSIPTFRMTHKICRQSNKVEEHSPSYYNIERTQYINMENKTRTQHIRRKGTVK